MRALVQRVSEASVEVKGSIVGAISKGLLVFVGVTHSDSREVAEKLARKIIGIRVFDDQNGQMNFSCEDVNGEFLVISQFTLYGNVDSGRRPGWSEAARPEQAEPLIEYFIECFIMNVNDLHHHSLIYHFIMYLKIFSLQNIQ